MIIETYEGDTLAILVAVSEDGVAKDLTGATVNAVAQRADGRSNPDVSGVAALVSEAGGTVSIDFDAGDLAAGLWRLQLRATLGGETQTVAEVEVRSHASWA